jgi:hypothetical protein
MVLYEARNTMKWKVGEPKHHDIFEGTLLLHGGYVETTFAMAVMCCVRAICTEFVSVDHVTGKDDEVVKLYDLTSLCTDVIDEKGPNPFTVPVAMLLYRWVLSVIVGYVMTQY